jgi:hypothetical protein
MPHTRWYSDLSEEERAKVEALQAAVADAVAVSRRCASIPERPGSRGCCGRRSA